MSCIYIPGMEMPTSCFYCPFRRKVDPEDIMCIVTGEVFEETFAGTIETRNRGNCPLVPVPEHGRLIDADALTTHMERNLWAIEDRAEKKLGFNETIRRGMQYGHAVCVDAVNAAPTIIPASKEGDNG